VPDDLFVVRHARQDCDLPDDLFVVRHARQGREFA
jgi:hypothetical protein